MAYGGTGRVSVCEPGRWVRYRWGMGDINYGYVWVCIAMGECKGMDMCAVVMGGCTG